MDIFCNRNTIQYHSMDSCLHFANLKNIQGKVEDFRGYVLNKKTTLCASSRNEIENRYGRGERLFLFRSVRFHDCNPQFRR